MEVSVMYQERKICADFCHKEKKCFYAKIVEEHGEYPVITFEADVKEEIPDLATMHNVKTRVDTTRFCVYCTHSHYSEEKFIGTVEPYFSCFAPNDCPELSNKCKTAANIFQRIKNLLKK